VAAMACGQVRKGHREAHVEQATGIWRPLSVFLALIAFAKHR